MRDIQFARRLQQTPIPLDEKKGSAIHYEEWNAYRKQERRVGQDFGASAQSVALQEIRLSTCASRLRPQPWNQTTCRKALRNKAVVSFADSARIACGAYGSSCPCQNCQLRFGSPPATDFAQKLMNFVCRRSNRNCLISRPLLEQRVVYGQRLGKGSPDVRRP
jgi:hypothetical protein